MKCLVTFVSRLHLIWLMTEVHTHVRVIAKHVSYLTLIVGVSARLCPLTDKIGPITPMDVTFEKVTESYISVWETVQGGQEVGPRPALSNLVTWSRRRAGLTWRWRWG